jgi:hypothetical protein
MPDFAVSGKLTGAGVGLFLVATAESFNVYSAFCSSPWTAENFGADEAKARSTKEYVLIAGAANIGLGLGASLLADMWWPLVGTSLVTVVMTMIYWRALRRGMSTGSTGWQRS